MFEDGMVTILADQELLMDPSQICWVFHTAQERQRPNC